MSEAAVLSVVLFLPLAGIGLVMLSPADRPGHTRALTFALMLVQFFLYAFSIGNIVGNSQDTVHVTFFVFQGNVKTFIMMVSDT